MVPKICHFHNLHPILPILQKGSSLLQLSDHGDVIETQTIILYLCTIIHISHKDYSPQNFLANSAPGDSTTCLSESNTHTVNSCNWTSLTWTQTSAPENNDLAANNKQPPTPYSGALSKQNPRQKVFNRWALHLRRAAWHSKIGQTLHWFIVFHITTGGLEFVWGLRDYPQKFFTRNPVICFLEGDEICAEMFAILTRFLENFLESENVARTKTAVGILQLSFSNFAAFFSRLLAYAFPGG